MTSRYIRKCRCEDVLNAFLSGSTGCVFFTLTTPDVVSFEEIRRRWRGFRHWLARELPKGAKYVMNYEIHPKGHGWHIHTVWNHYIDLRKYLRVIRSFGFGRVDISRVDSKGIADYLSKHALKAYSGGRHAPRGQVERMRLVNTSRGLPTLAGYVWESDLKASTHRLLVKSSGLIKSLPFSVSWRICELACLFGVQQAMLESFGEALLSPLPDDLRLWLQLFHNTDNGVLIEK